MHHRRSPHGFTLLELLITVVVLGILASLAIPTFLADVSNTKTAVARESAAAIARDAQGMASTATSANGVTPDANLYVPSAASEAGASVTSAAAGWTVEGSSGGQACLALPTSINAAFSITTGACG